MQITIQGHGVQVTPALKSYAQEKLEKLGKRGDQITRINAIFEIEKAQQVAKATIHASGIDIHATAEASDLYAATDLLFDKLDQQIKKHKEKVKNHRSKESLREVLE